MNLWQKYLLNRKSAAISKGFSLRFERGIEPEFRKLCMKFAKWLRCNYRFPVRLNIYIKDCEKIRILGGEMVYGGFRYYENRVPYIRIPARISPALREDYEDFEIYYSILGSLVHELTHYYQWIAELDLSERQANHFRFRMVEQFCNDCGLPF